MRSPKYPCRSSGVPARIEETFFTVKRFAVLIAALIGIMTPTLVACSDSDKPGVVNSVEGPEVTKATAKCLIKGSWSISVDPDGHENESIDERAKHRYYVCMSEAEAKTYKSGDRYPKGK